MTDVVVKERTNIFEQMQVAPEPALPEQLLVEVVQQDPRHRTTVSLAINTKAILEAFGIAQQQLREGIQTCAAQIQLENTLAEAMNLRDVTMEVSVFDGLSEEVFYIPTAAACKDAAEAIGVRSESQIDSWCRHSLIAAQCTPSREGGLTRGNQDRDWHTSNPTMQALNTALTNQELT